MAKSLKGRYTFNSFVIGGANRLAASAAQAVAESPGASYNPLFIYSASGLGKTHLLASIGNATREQDPERRVELLSLEDLVEAYQAAVAQGQGESFRRRFEDVDVLLVDDVQFLANRNEMQAELLRITEALQGGGHQIVLTSDRPPREIADLDERLISRFAGGLVVDISPPEYEARVAILRRKAEERGMVFESGVLEAIAEAESLNVRELLGSLNRVAAVQAVSDEPLSSEAVTDMFGVKVPPEADDGNAAVDFEELRRDSGPLVSEFDAFLSDITETVTQTVDAWRSRVGEAILRWEGEGYRTACLNRLLDADVPDGVDDTIRRFERDVSRLQELEREMVTLDRDAAGDAVFRDPDRLTEASQRVADARQGSHPLPPAAEHLNFETFARGKANEVALSAAHAVVEAPGHRYNPLVIVGGPGTGKTHLLQAIGNGLSAAGVKVACLSMQVFIEQLIEAIETDRVDVWRSRYRGAEALLLDDVHLAESKDRTQEELFNLFNALGEEDRQLVFTSNRPLGELSGIEPRLISRLGGGLVTDLGKPDRSIRAAASVRLLHRHEIDDADLAAYLADRAADSVRTVLEETQRVIDATEEQEVTLTAEFARDYLEGRDADESRRTEMRTSGIVVTSLGALKTREKTVRDWPDIRDRMIEELD